MISRLIKQPGYGFVCRTLEAVVQFPASLIFVSVAITAALKPRCIKSHTQSLGVLGVIPAEKAGEATRIEDAELFLRIATAPPTTPPSPGGAFAGMLNHMPPASFLTLPSALSSATSCATTSAMASSRKGIMAELECPLLERSQDVLEASRGLSSSSPRSQAKQSQGV